MEAFYSVLLLILATIVANTIYPYFSAIPQAFYQIFAGALLSLIPMFHHFALEPEAFMLLIIGPLMFYDGKNASAKDLRRNVGSIASMAIVLAVLTVVAMGYLAHSMLAGIPLALAFALAAIVTPTDAVAVSSITTNMAVPERVMGMLERESLFNDASGLVAFNLALTASTTGQFSVGMGVKHFLIVFFGGLLIGVVLGGLAVWTRVLLVQSGMDSSSVIVPYDLIVPFLIYLAAEHLELSGILAVVAAGLMYSFSSNQLRLSSTQLQLVSRSSWRIVTSLLNGFVFVLLGATLPTVWVNIQQDRTKDLLTFFILAVVLYVVMTALRYLWIRFDWALIHSKNKDRRSNALVGALSGVHGTITLAMAFSLPLTLHGAAFPYRNTMIFVAAVVIILSLLVPTIILPFFLPKKTATVDAEQLEQERKALVAYASERLAQENPDTPASAQTVIQVLNSQTNNTRPDKKATRLLLNRATQMEVAAVQGLADAGTIPAPFANRYVRLLLMKSQMSRHNPLVNTSIWFRFVGHRLWHLITHHGDRRKRRERRQAGQRHSHRGRDRSRPGHVSAAERERRESFMLVEKTIYTQVMTFLTEISTIDNQAEVNAVRYYYNARHRRFESTQAADEQSELFIQAFQYEYTYIRQRRSSKEIPTALADELYQKVSTDQMLYTQEIAGEE